MSSDRRREPTTDELRAMAYVDGELDPDERREFETRLAKEPALGREVTELRALDLMSRQMAAPEPADHEWERLSAEPLQRGGASLGFALILFGTLGLAVFACVHIARSDELHLLLKLFLLGTVAGVSLVFLTVLRGRLRTMPFDPYTRVKR